MGGFLTKIYIGSSLLVLVGSIITLLMVNIGNNYGVQQEDIYQDQQSRYDARINKLEQIQSEASDVAETSDIDQETQDTAQFQGAISAENQKLNVMSVLKGSVDDFTNIIPVHPMVVTLLISILVVAFIGGGYYMLRGITP